MRLLEADTEVEVLTAVLETRAVGSEPLLFSFLSSGFFGVTVQSSSSHGQMDSLFL